MPPSGPPTEPEIWKIARRTTDIIQSKLTRNVCLFGSAACSLWTNIRRVPNVRLSYHLALSILSLLKGFVFKTQDIDIVVSGEELDAENIKEVIVGADDRYYLLRSRQRGATHQILYCRLPGWKTDPGRCVKVDILVSPTLGLPDIPNCWDGLDAVLINCTPIMPLFDLLVMKTQGWWDHRTSHRSDFRAKESADVSDILALLERAREEGVSWDDEVYIFCRHSEEFLDRALALANRFVRVYGGHQQWRALGLPV